MEQTRRHVFAASTAVTGAIAATAIPGHPFGLNWALVAVLVVGAALFLAHPGLDRFDLGFVLTGVVLMTFFLFRSAEWLLALDLIAAVGLGAVGFGRSRGWFGLAFAPLRLLAHLPRGMAFALGPVARWVTTSVGPRRISLVRGVVLTAGLLVVFGALFRSADPAFASLTRQFLLPELDLGLVPGRVLMGLLTVATTGALVLLSAKPANEKPTSADRVLVRSSFKLAPGEWITTLVVLDALFASFVLLQLTVLFGGRTQVLETAGLTYAQYARGGFFQLVAVAFLTLAVIAGAVRFGDTDEGRQRSWMKLLLGGLCALTLVILASAMKRMNLYEEVYGFTRLRLLVDTTILWLAAMFGLLLAAGWLWKAAWLPRATLALSAVAVLGLNLVNPDATIAERNIARFEQTGNLDADYLSTMSVDAVPALMRLEEPERSCVLGRVASRAPMDPSPWAFNVSRKHALDVLDSVSQASAPSCPGLLGL